jgi:hypothetical protein
VGQPTVGAGQRPLLVGAQRPPSGGLGDRQRLAFGETQVVDHAQPPADHAERERRRRAAPSDDDGAQRGSAHLGQRREHLEEHRVVADAMTVVEHERQPEPRELPEEAQRELRRFDLILG